jgi:hypothetical protein
MALYWILWLVVGFGVPECVALARHKYNNTLSECVWRWCQVTPGNTLAHWTALHVFVALLMLWLFFHIVFGIWR